jgi:hypothetical protein
LAQKAKNDPMLVNVYSRSKKKNKLDQY